MRSAPSTSLVRRCLIPVSLLAAVGACAPTPRTTSDETKLAVVSRPPELCDLARGGNVDTIAGLIHSPDDANKRCEDRVTLLERAAFWGFPDVVALLLERGADPMSLGSVGTPVLNLLAMSNADRLSQSGPRAAKFLDAVERVLGHDKMVEVRDQEVLGQTALARAVMFGNAGVVKELLKRGADPNGRVTTGSFLVEIDPDEWPLFFFARVKQQSDGALVLKYLLDAGAKVDAVSSSGKTWQQAVDTYLRVDADRDEFRTLVTRQIAERAARAKQEAAEEAAREREREANREADRQRQRQNDAEDRQARNDQAQAIIGGFVQGLAAGAAAASKSTPVTPYVPPPPPRGSSGSTAPSINSPDVEAQRRREARDSQQRDQAQERAAQAEAEKAARAQRVQAALASVRGSVQLAATKCGADGGEGAYWLRGSRPDRQGLACVNLSWSASCPQGIGATSGTVRNYIGANCGMGDSVRIMSTPKCPVERVTVVVTDVQLCQN